MLPFENQFDFNYSWIELFSTEYAFLAKQILNILYQSFYCVIIGRLKEVVMNFKWIFILPKKFHKF